MHENTTMVAKIKAQLSKLSGIISKGFPKPTRRLIKEILYGIQATKDVKLSNISRCLNERQRLINTEDRLSRNLDDVDFTDGINGEICRLGALPEAYIYPKDKRPIRDLLPRRNRLVSVRAAGYVALRRVLLQHGIFGYSQDQIKRFSEDQMC